jgi:hypothetical protein
MGETNTFAPGPNASGGGVSNVNIVQLGGTAVSSTVGLPVEVLSSALPANAAQETGGNLALLVALAQQSARMVDLLSFVIARLDAINLTLAHMANIYVEPDDVMKVIQ